MGEPNQDSRGFTIGDAIELLDTVMRYSGDVIKVLDLDGCVVTWNPACEELYGWSSAQAVGSRLPHIPEDMRLRVIADNRAIAASGRVVERTAEAMRSDGTCLNVRLIVIPVYDDEGHPAGILSIGREAAECSRFESERADFLSHVDAALKGPLATIASSGQLLARPEIACDAERRSRVVDQLLESARNASQAVEELLVLSNLGEPGGATREPLDLNALVTSAVAGFDGRVLIEFGSSPALVLGNADLLELAIADMIAAAVAAGDADAIVGVTVEGGDACISVDARIAPGRPDAAMPPLSRVSAVARAHGGALSTGADPRSVALELRIPAG